MLRVYRANATFNNVRAGQYVEIDPEHPEWAKAIAKGMLTPRFDLEADRYLSDSWGQDDR